MTFFPFRYRSSKPSSQSPTLKSNKKTTHLPTYKVHQTPSQSISPLLLTHSPISLIVSPYRNALQLYTQGFYSLGLLADASTNVCLVDLNIVKLITIIALLIERSNLWITKSWVVWGVLEIIAGLFVVQWIGNWRNRIEAKARQMNIGTRVF